LVSQDPLIIYRKKTLMGTLLFIMQITVCYRHVFTTDWILNNYEIHLYDFKNLDGSNLSFYSDDGNFIWNCIVEDEVVIDGEFSFSSKLIGETKYDLRELIEN